MMWPDSRCTLSLRNRPPVADRLAERTELTRAQRQTSRSWFVLRASVRCRVVVAAEGVLQESPCFFEPGAVADRL
jgi:hypothetical protein